MEFSIRKYSGHPLGQNQELQTCHAFLTQIEDKYSTSINVKTFSEHLEGPALDWFLNLKGNLTDWPYIKDQFKLAFGVQLSVRQKVNIRQSLRQQPEENISDFAQRCVLAQYAITEDHSSLKDPAFERDVLLNFLLGMKHSLQGKVIASNERTLDGFLKEAIKTETEDKVIVKEEDSDLPDFNDILPKNGKWKVTIDRIGTPSPTLELETELKPTKRKRSKVSYEETETEFNNEEMDFKLEPDLKPVNSHMVMCKVCGRYIADEKRLDLHMLVRHRKNQDDFACDLCGKILKSEDSLKKHVQFTCLKERPVSCHICNKPFIDKKSVRIHVASVHFKEKPHLCSECGKGFCTPTSLKTHRENVHEKLRRHVCKVCNKTFGNQGNLYVHNQRHHERYNFCCDTCGKQFCRPFELRRHMAVKHGEGTMPYPCTQCDKAFFEPKELKTHISITHDGERPCSCPVCPETFTRKSAMRRHIKRKHPEMVPILLQPKTTLTNNGTLVEQKV